MRRHDLELIADVQVHYDFLCTQIQHSRSAENDSCAILVEDGRALRQDDALHHDQAEPRRVLQSGQAAILHEGQPTRQL